MVLMDEYGCPDNGCYGGYAQPFDTYSAPDHYAESYNYATIDPIAIVLRQQRENDERRRLAAAPGQAGKSATRGYEAYPPRASTHGSSPAEGSPAWWAEVARSRAEDPDAPHQALAALAAGQKYYWLPSEAASWRRPLRGPSGKYDPQWWKMFNNADGRSRVLAELLGYTGARDADGWIRPTRWELLKMGFWTAHRYAFYYAEFAEEYGRKIPRWVALLRSPNAYTPSAAMFD